MAYARTIFAHEVKALKDKVSELAEGEQVLTSVGARTQAEVVRAVRMQIESIVTPNGHDYLEQLPKA